jgi:hypothetical protein
MNEPVKDIGAPVEGMIERKSSSLGRIRSRRSVVVDTVYPETDLDQGIVGWEGQDDPENPLNFPRARKWGLLGLVSAITFVSPLASSMFAPAVSFMGQEFGETKELLLSFTVSVYVLGYVVSGHAYDNLHRG